MFVQFPPKQHSANPNAMSTAAFTSARTAPEGVERARRAEDSAARVDAQKAEDWTCECMFDCYND